MAKSDLGKSLKNKLQSTVDSAKSAAKEVDVSEIKSKVSSTVDQAKGAIQDVKIPDIKEVTKRMPDVGEIKTAVKGAVDDVKDIDIKGEMNAAAQKIKKVTKVEKVEPATDVVLSTANITCLSTKEALKIFYYLMAADEQITEDEDAKFNEIGSAFDPDFVNIKEQVVEECKQQLIKCLDGSDHYDVVQDGIEDALIASIQTINTPITPKLLLWDMLTIAYSDGDYEDIERKIIKYVVRKCGIDNAVFLEMESSLLTLMDIEKELNWIKTTDRPYLQIEAVVNELADRKNVICESVMDLIRL